jgi:hypothetical protein
MNCIDAAPSAAGAATSSGQKKKAGSSSAVASMSLQYGMQNQQRLVDELGVTSCHAELFTLQAHVKDLFQSLVREQQALYKLQVQTVNAQAKDGPLPPAMVGNGAPMSAAGGSSVLLSNPQQQQQHQQQQQPHSSAIVDVRGESQGPVKHSYHHDPSSFSPVPEEPV